MANKHFAIYVRVSTQDQTVENQLIPLKQHAERMGWTYDIYQEKESTRKTRPVQWELYNKLLKKEYEGLLIYKFDRWARSTKELVEHIERLVERNIQVVSYSENLDLDTSMGKAMLTIISAFAQLERDMIRERTLAGLARARAQGKKLGRPRKDGKTYKKPSREEVNKLMNNGMTVRKIATELKTSKYWAHTVMSEIRQVNQGGISNGN